MASRGFLNRETVQREVVISNGDHTHVCCALIDGDCWPSGGVPAAIAGFLDLPKPHREPLASSDRLLLRLQETGELYRMILDVGTGRFVARQL